MLALVRLQVDLLERLRDAHALEVWVELKEQRIVLVRWIRMRAGRVKVSVHLRDERLVERGEGVEQVLRVELGRVVKLVADLLAQQLHLTDAHDRIHIGCEQSAELARYLCVELGVQVFFWSELLVSISHL